MSADLNDVRSFDDELLETAAASRIARHSTHPVLVEWFAKVDAEVARRAEIRCARLYEIAFGDNRYGFTEADVVDGKHDASWYESRQTESEWLSEVGAE